MLRSNENAITFVLLLVSIAPFIKNSLVYGSSISDRISKRPDPLRKFRHYGGDYDIRNKHYWASASFTGFHGYAVAGIWLLCGVGFGTFMVVKNSNGRTSTLTVDHSKSSKFIVLLLLLLFTTFAIAASSVVIAANQKSAQRAGKLEETIYGAADDASRTITKVKATLQQMQTFLLPYDSKICNLLNLTAHRLRNISLNIHSFIQRDMKAWDRAIQTLYVVNLVVVSVNLVLLVAGSVLLALQFRPAGIIALIFCCWILTTLSWILAGVDFFFYTFIGDTCSTLKDFEEGSPKNSLSNILPCPKSTDSVKTLEQINHSVRSFISEINSRIREVLEMKKQNEAPVPVPEVCDPFSGAPDYRYSPENCGKDSIPIGDLPCVLSRFICYEANNTSEDCLEDGKFLPESIYTISMAYSRSIQDFIDIYPDLSSLMKCSPVRRAFTEIVASQCRPFEMSTQELWASTLALSLVMVVLVLLWIDEAAIQDSGMCFCRWSIFSRPVQGG